MKYTLSGLALIAFFSATALAKEAAIESSGAVRILADVEDHEQEGGKSHFDRIPGITLMEGVTEASVHKAAALIRKEGHHSNHRSGGEAASELEQSVVKQSTKTHEGKRAKLSGTTWTVCGGAASPCKCESGRNMVIRYQREHGIIEQANVMTNWWYRDQQRDASTPMYTETPAAEFNKGFKTTPTFNAHKLQACGGGLAWAKDCVGTAPVDCNFDDESNNKHDAKAGEYCCNSEFGYCSYKCVGEETFECPLASSDKNFLGGMDPAGHGVVKKCYRTMYADGKSPENSDDADLQDAIPAVDAGH